MQQLLFKLKIIHRYCNMGDKNMRATCFFEQYAPATAASLCPGKKIISVSSPFPHLHRPPQRCVCVCACVCACVCLCVCERERERERKRKRERKRDRERQRETVCVYSCVCARAPSPAFSPSSLFTSMVSECVCVRQERENVRECVYV